MRAPRGGDVYGAAGTPPFIRAAFPILLFFEDRKHVSEGPSFRSVLSPAVEVALHAPRPHHGIDAAASAKHVTEGHVEIAVVQLRQRGDGKVVIERPGDIVKPDARIHDGRCIVGSSRLYDKDLRAGRGQFRGKYLTGSARSQLEETDTTQAFLHR